MLSICVRLLKARQGLSIKCFLNYFVYFAFSMMHILLFSLNELCFCTIIKFYLLWRCFNANCYITLIRILYHWIFLCIELGMWSLLHRNPNRGIVQFYDSWISELSKLVIEVGRYRIVQDRFELLQAKSVHDCLGSAVPTNNLFFGVFISCLLMYLYHHVSKI